MAADKNDLTPRENEVLALAWQCFENEPKVNLKKLAELAGYTTGSAGFAMGIIKRKLRAKANAKLGGTMQPSISPRKGSKNMLQKNETPKRPAKRPTNGEHNVDVTGSAKKITRTYCDDNKSNGFDILGEPEDHEVKIKAEEI